MKCAAVIVSYNPNIELLKKNVDAVYWQVSKVIIYDNASNNVDDIESCFSSYEKMEIVRSKENNGISKAINDSIKSLDDTFDWILTLDQDSIVPKNIISEYSKFVDFPDVKMISPRVQLAVGREIQAPTTSKPFEYIKRCITSACFLNKEALYSIGGLDEQMFIDWVDHDLCKHFDIVGYKMLQCNNVVLYHNLGSDKPILLSIILHKLFKNKIIYQTYSPFRLYYMIRNSLYYMRKYKGQLDDGEKKQICKLIIWHLSLKSILTSSHKIQVTKSIYRGLRDGISLHIDIYKKYL